MNEDPQNFCVFSTFASWLMVDVDVVKKKHKHKTVDIFFSGGTFVIIPLDVYWVGCV
jgi:hypothetical protein